LLGRDAGFAQGSKRRRVVALRELLAAGIHYQRDMCVRRALATECIDELDLACRRVDEVGASDHVVDLHREIIDHDGELIREHAVATADDEVADRCRNLFVHLAENSVDESDLAAGNREADRGVEATVGADSLEPIVFSGPGPELFRVGRGCAAVRCGCDVFEVAARPRAGKDSLGGE